MLEFIAAFIVGVAILVAIRIVLVALFRVLVALFQALVEGLGTVAAVGLMLWIIVAVAS